MAKARGLKLAGELNNSQIAKSVVFPHDDIPLERKGIPERPETILMRHSH